MSLVSEGIISSLQREANKNRSKADYIKSVGGLSNAVQSRVNEEIDDRKTKNKKEPIDPKMYDDLVKALKGDMEDSRDI
jgi:hypothetical protein